MTASTDGRERIETVEIPPLRLEGALGIPASRPVGLVLFAHGSGSSRHSPRNNYVASALRREGLATVLFDLLTEAEADDRANVFDIGLLADRLLAATVWARTFEKTRSLPIGYFGASTGAAAALTAAARLGHKIGAVVSRGGRPDLAGEALTRVEAPTLLIVGGHDTEVLALNRAALRALRCESTIEIVPRATHLFEEPGALDVVVGLALEWFLAHLAAPKRR
ncbi:MAG: dienelactone hydrolase family protein [Alphaproteobacteria bacterium]|nr:dienelactone hydrolase family protein [Alphaproteobacteria bacterium]